MKTLKILFISVTIFLICGAPDISFNALSPALINVPAHIQSLSVINRSVTDKGIFEKVVTAELPNESRLASQAALEGFSGFLQDSRRFDIIITGKEFPKADLPEKFPEPLTWDEISNICAQYKTDGVIALEVFKSDYIIPTNMVIITTGFRLYDSREKKIIDQEIYRSETYWNGQVNSIAGQ